jgi:hypothetical protein
MNACPACSQPVGPSDLVCPKCGISLHPGTATYGPASGEGKGLSVVAIVVIAIVGILLVVGCLGLLGASVFFLRSSAPMPSATPYAAPLLPLTETTEAADSAETDSLQANPQGGPPQEAPGGPGPSDETPGKP